MTQSAFATRAAELFRAVQSEITTALEALDAAHGTKPRVTFFEESWDRPGGGGGRTRVMAEGNVFEKAGVNFSAVHGEAPRSIAGGISADADGLTFFATGVSLVLHPHSPHVPTVHANFRYFERSDGTAWFGGGMDLTPYYLDESDARHFHQTIKATCDRHDPSFYPRYKQWCDEYFFIKHRGESRGVGGLFFDELNASDPATRESAFAFVTDIARTFLPAYLPIAEQHATEPWSEDERTWQLLRRGRYVEFNLVYDRGTRFGLETNGRTESILMSLPTLARWEYDHHPAPGSREARLLDVLRSPLDWAG